jgi:hypothetical protein
MNLKVAFRNTLYCKNEGPLTFVPFIYGLAARMMNVPLQDMVQDASYYTSALEGAYKLLQSNAIATNYDDTIESECCGFDVEWQGEYQAPTIVKGCEFSTSTPEDFLSSGRIPVLLEVTKRLVLALGREVAIASVISGPCSLVKSCLNESELNNDAIQELIKNVGSCLTRWVRSLCELKVDAIIFREDPLGTEFTQEFELHKVAYKGVYTTLFNIVRAYNIFPVLITNKLPLERIKEIHGTLRPGGIILRGVDFDFDTLLFLKSLSETLRIGFGLPLPIGQEPQESLWSRFEAIESFVAEHKPKGFFLTSDGEIPFDVPVEILRKLMERLRNETSLEI